MNLVLDGAIDLKDKIELGTVVIRGQSIVSITAHEKVSLPEVQRQ